MIKDKAYWRKRLLIQRRKLTPRVANTYSQDIVRQCIEHLPWDKTHSIHTYLPIENRNEVSTWALLEYLWNTQTHVVAAVPLVRNGGLHSASVNIHTKWQENTLGIPEPQPAKVVNRDSKFDVIIVPTLGFDSKGYRLGSGFGYYDRFLSTQPAALTVGLCYQFGYIESGLPHEPHDVPLKMIITERQVYGFRRQTS